MGLEYKQNKKDWNRHNFQGQETNKQQYFVDNSPEFVESTRLQKHIENSPETIKMQQYSEDIYKSTLHEQYFLYQQQPPQKVINEDKIKKEYSGEGKIINGVVVKHKEDDEDGYYKLTYPDGTIDRVQPIEFEFYAKDLGHDTFFQSIAESFSIEASVFLLALGANESKYATKNDAEHLHNMFSIMGGSKENLGTKDGHLQKFDTWEEGFTKGFVAQIVDGERKGEMKFPLLRKLLESNDFSIDDINKAFGQFNYHKHNNDDLSASNSYDSNKKTNFALKYTQTAIKSVIPMMILDLYRRIEIIVNNIKNTPDQATISNSLDRLMAYRGAIIGLQNAKKKLKQKVQEYAEEQKNKKK